MIVVETPFDEQRNSTSAFDSVKKPAQDYASENEDQSRRASSIDARKLFSVPLQAFRRSNKIQAQPVSEVAKPVRKNVKSKIMAQGHKSLWKQQDTSSTLDKVSTTLESVKKARKAKLHSWKIKSASSTSSSDKLESGVSTGKAISSSFNVVGNTPTENPASATSSILDLHRGSTPQNSPAELATYKIKRSPSAETEEFLKIDISIRGQTSYLPSEARRIHTPPLPQDGDNSRNRGFFFDYRLPEAGSPQSPQSSLTTPQDERSKEKADTHLAPKNELVKRVATKLVAPLLPPHLALAGNKLSKSPSKTKTGDWHDARLADLDRASPEANPNTPSDGRLSSQPSYHGHASVADTKRKKLEAQLDYEIPEHLPSSPLCPRNPKYWRVVKQRGSQFRGCWMHGFGEYVVVPGLQAGRLPDPVPNIEVTADAET